MSTVPKDINNLPFHEALELYNQMRQAYYDGDDRSIELLKKEHPSLFESETANLLRTTVDLLNKMQNEPPKFTIH